MAFIKKILSAQNDAELVKQYKTGGDINVLGELYGRYMELVYGVCLKYFKEPEEAKDAVINIFEELATRIVFNVLIKIIDHSEFTRSSVPAGV